MGKGDTDPSKINIELINFRIVSYCQEMRNIFEKELCMLEM